MTAPQNSPSREELTARHRQASQPAVRRGNRGGELPPAPDTDRQPRRTQAEFVRLGTARREPAK
jgi:hypothetical protein